MPLVCLAIKYEKAKNIAVKIIARWPMLTSRKPGLNIRNAPTIASRIAKILRRAKGSPKKIAEVMGHTYETHLLSYARFDSKDLAKSFDQVPNQIKINPII